MEHVKSFNKTLSFSDEVQKYSSMLAKEKRNVRKEVFNEIVKYIDENDLIKEYKIEIHESALNFPDHNKFIVRASLYYKSK